jgi:hypothetical protein
MILRCGFLRYRFLQDTQLQAVQNILSPSRGLAVLLSKKFNSKNTNSKGTKGQYHKKKYVTQAYGAADTVLLSFMEKLISFTP